MAITSPLYGLRSRQGAVAVRRFANVTKHFRVGKVVPRFLLFLKSRGKRSSLELPAKSSSMTEAVVLLSTCFVLLVIVAVVIRACHQR